MTEFHPAFENRSDPNKNLSPTPNLSPGGKKKRRAIKNQDATTLEKWKK